MCLAPAANLFEGGDKYRGWKFHPDRPSPLDPSHTHLLDVYRLADPEYPHKSLSTPVLFDRVAMTIVNNESAE